MGDCLLETVNLLCVALPVIAIIKQYTQPYENGCLTTFRSIYTYLRVHGCAHALCRSCIGASRSKLNDEDERDRVHGDENWKYLSFCSKPRRKFCLRIEFETIFAEFVHWIVSCLHSSLCVYVRWELLHLFVCVLFLCHRARLLAHINTHASQFAWY